MTIYEIELILHYHCSPEADNVVKEGRVNDFYHETVDRLVSDGLLARIELNKYGGAFKCTERGNAFSLALQEVPLPARVWLIEWPTGHKVIRQ